MFSKLQIAPTSSVLKALLPFILVQMVFFDTPIASASDRCVYPALTILAVSSRLLTIFLTLFPSLLWDAYNIARLPFRVNHFWDDI